jgi:uncharacterized repeat protein (TIGR04076 family)
MSQPSRKVSGSEARGGDFVGVKPGTFVTCCTDGFRPVFFKLERIDAATS